MATHNKTSCCGPNERHDNPPLLSTYRALAWLAQQPPATDGAAASTAGPVSQCPTSTRFRRQTLSDKQTNRHRHRVSCFCYRSLTIKVSGHDRENEGFESLRNCDEGAVIGLHWSPVIRWYGWVRSLFFSLCPVTDISATVAPIDVKFCTMVDIGPEQVFSPFGAVLPWDPPNLTFWA